MDKQQRKAPEPNKISEGSNQLKGAAFSVNRTNPGFDNVQRKHLVSDSVGGISVNPIPEHDFAGEASCAATQKGPDDPGHFANAGLCEGQRLDICIGQPGQARPLPIPCPPPKPPPMPAPGPKAPSFWRCSGVRTDLNLVLIALRSFRMVS